MEEKGLFGFIYTIMEWVTRIAYVNILWVLFTALGLFIFGLAPATISMYALTKEWTKGNTDSKIFLSFWNTYRNEFMKSNLLLWPLIVVGYMLYIDFQYLPYTDGPIFFVMLFVFINVSIVFIIISLYVIPTYVSFQYNLFQYYKNAFIIGISAPFITLSMIISLIVIGLIMLKVPGLIPFFLASTVSLVIMWYATRSFLKVEKKSIIGQ